MSGEHLQSAIAHYEAALKASWPDGAKGAVFDEWNAARKAIPEVGPEWLCSQSQHEAGKRHVAAMLAASPQAAPAQTQQAAPALGFNDAVRIARGCTDYGGGHRGKDAYEVYQHGIQTVIAALEAAQRSGLEDTQVRALHCMGAATPPQQAPAPQPVALTDEQRIDWLCEEAEFTCGQWQVVIDSDKESFLDAVDEMVRAAHGITQPSQQERT